MYNGYVVGSEKYFVNGDKDYIVFKMADWTIRIEVVGVKDGGEWRWDDGD